MLGASSFLMVSALIIQSLFSRRAFWEFPLMEGQIDSYEIVITAFLSNECTHQIAKEDRVNHSWYGCISHQDISRGERENGPIRQCQITQQGCLSFVSTMLLLPVSICFPSRLWVTDGAFGGAEHHVRVAGRWFLCQVCLFRPSSLLAINEQKQMTS